jgi:hypothetical protein
MKITKGVAGLNACAHIVVWVGVGRTIIAGIGEPPSNVILPERAPNGVAAAAHDQVESETLDPIFNALANRRQRLYGANPQKNSFTNFHL